MMSKKPDVGGELYAFITGEGAAYTVADIAKQFNLRAPLVTHYIVEHCVTHGLPLPAFKLVNEKVRTKKLKRGSKSRDIRISQLSLEKANLGEEMRFKLMFDAALQVVVVLPETSPISSMQDLSEALAHPESWKTPIAVLAAPEAKPSGVEAPAKAAASKLKALRPPRVKKQKESAQKA